MHKLGKRPPSAKPTLALADFVTPAVLTPAHPGRADNLRGLPYGMYGNDRFGVCGPTSVANSRILITGDLGGAVIAPSQDDVYDLYRRSGNPSFDPATGADDNGVDVKSMLAEVVRNGIGGLRAVAFASVNVHLLGQVRAAIDIFGFLILGVNLERAQQSQTSTGTWDYSPTDSSEWGGHAILAGAYTSAHNVAADVKAITWAQQIGLTDRFWNHQTDEAYVLIWPELLDTARFDRHVDRAKLAADFRQLTGRTLAA